MYERHHMCIYGITGPDVVAGSLPASIGRVWFYLYRQIGCHYPARKKMGLCVLFWGI